MTRENRSSIVGLILATWVCVLAAGRTEASPPDKASPGTKVGDEGIAFFEGRIRPILVKHCQECHSSDSKNVRGGLLVDSRESLLAGGDSGPAIVPGNADESLLLQALRHEGFEMPPTGKLPAGVIADFETWIQKGAADPRTGAQPSRVKPGIDLEAGRQFWSFRPPIAHPAPATEDRQWPRSAIDRFVLAVLEREGLSPAPDADRRTLIRRASYDLTGLPPTPEEIDAFLADESPTALERLVDRLLDSPGFGERWGRHWLDVARYADSTGGGRSMIFDSSWRYRDYVIEAFNQDKPFDRFIVEQIAGDLLPFEDYRQGQQQLVATAFLALGPTNYEEQDKTQLEMDVIDEQIDTTGRAFLGMTLGCARCHDHKFDPIPTTDYYALAGIFKSTHTLVHDNVSTWVKRALPVDDATARALKEYERELATLESRLKEKQQERKRLQSFVAAVTIDDDDASFTGSWATSSSVKPFVGSHYRYASGGDASAVYELDGRIEPGRYSVRVAYTPHANRSKGTLVTVAHAEGETSVRIDQTKAPPVEGLYVDVGSFQFTRSEGNRVTIGTGGAEHIVVADAVQLVPLDKRNTNAGARIVADVSQLPGVVVDDSAAERTGEWILSTYTPSYVRDGYLHDNNADKGKKSIRYRVDVPKSGEYEVRLSYTPGSSRATRVPVNIAYDGGDETVYVNEREKPSVDGLFTRLGTYPFANDQTAIVTVSNEGTTDGHVVVDAVQFVPASEASQPEIAAAAVTDTGVEVGDALSKRVNDLDRELVGIQGAITSLKKSAPPTAPEAMGVEEEKAVGDCALCIRGEIKNLGPKVPRGFVTVATRGAMTTIPPNASGRLELAQWIASSDNPLTARVLVNRVWSHLFGAGLVRTVDQFGATGEPPSHPELLDTLAVRFMEEGWSIKRLVREIMLSRAYQMSSERTLESREKDPGNRLLAGQNRRRLDAEALYDSILSLAGTLDPTMGGPTVRAGTKSEYGYSFDAGRRAVYLPVFRNRLHDLFAAFDFPDPNLSAGQRNTSTLSTQSLYLMNSPFVMDQARHAASRLLKDASMDDEGRIERLFERAYSRPPRESEKVLIHAFLSEHEATEDATRLQRWTNVCQTVFASLDFRYVD